MHSYFTVISTGRGAEVLVEQAGSTVCWSVERTTAGSSTADLIIVMGTRRILSLYTPAALP